MTAYTAKINNDSKALGISILMHGLMFAGLLSFGGMAVLEQVKPVIVDRVSSTGLPWMTPRQVEHRSALLLPNRRQLQRVRSRNGLSRKASTKASHRLRRQHRLQQPPVRLSPCPPLPSKPYQPLKDRAAKLPAVLPAPERTATAMLPQARWFQRQSAAGAAV
jgi:hypothetical protein